MCIRDSFWDKEYAHAKSTAYFKSKAWGGEQKVTLKGGKHTLEWTQKHKFKAGGEKYNTEAKVSTKGTHTLTVEHDRKFGDAKVNLKNETNWTAESNAIANVFKASTKLKDLGVRWTFTADCGKDKCDLTNHFIKKISKAFVASSYLTYDYTGKTMTEQGVGLWSVSYTHLTLPTKA